MTTTARLEPVSQRGARLSDRYEREEGHVYLNGIQALVRLPLEQARRDRQVELRIGTFISGYPGSPLGGYDLALKQASTLMSGYDITLQPGQNEELAMTALMGTQMLDRYPHSRYDGVTGLWYGKGPGLDRSGDALRHANFAGTTANGAVVVLSGEDHEAKSSTLPTNRSTRSRTRGCRFCIPPRSRSSSPMACMRSPCPVTPAATLP